MFGNDGFVAATALAVPSEPAGAGRPRQQKRSMNGSIQRNAAGAVLTYYP